MIIMKLNGGLGNQLFQYAFGRNLAIRNNTELKLDLTNYKEDDLDRKYELHLFNIPEKPTTHLDIQNIKYLPPSIFLKMRYWLTGRKINLNRLQLNNDNIRVQNGYKFKIEDVLNSHDNMYYDGFWQFEKPFVGIKNILLNELTLKNPAPSHTLPLIEKINNTNSVSIHFRRGDYLNKMHYEEFGSVCTMEYYHKAVKKICGIINNPTFYIFSDDIEWVKKNFNISNPTTYVDNNCHSPCTEDLRLMSLCKHNIIPNSSFSWWGAWLNTNNSKVVISPKIWVKPDRFSYDISPSEWILLD